jgi:hypothetical protein
MATVNLTLRSKKNPSKLYLRLTNTRKHNYNIPINIFVNPKHWNEKKQNIRNVSSIPNSREMNLKISRLKMNIIQELNTSFLNGEGISKEWLENSIDNFFKKTVNTNEK